MSTINSLLNNNLYYQLGTGTSGTSQTSGVNSLVQALDGTSSGTGSSSNLDTVNLSPEALQYLANLNSGNSTSNTTTNTNTNFTLSTQQQQTIMAILAKYKDAPYTQDTFNSIQNDLASARLSANQLSLLDQANNFNPTAMLIDDLNGDIAAANALASSSTLDEQTKSSNYMQQIISEWKSISSTAGSSSAALNAITPTSSTGGA